MNTTCLSERVDQNVAAYGGRPERALQAAPIPVPIQPSCIS